MPALFLRGQCIGWDKIFKQLQAKHPNLMIKQPEESEDINDLFEDLESAQKLLVFLRTNSCSSVKITQIFRRLEERFVYFVKIK